MGFYPLNHLAVRFEFHPKISYFGVYLLLFGLEELLNLNPHLLLNLSFQLFVALSDHLVDLGSAGPR